MTITWHIKQLHWSWKTRQYRGNLDYIQWHSWRLFQLWRWAEEDKLNSKQEPEQD